MKMEGLDIRPEQKVYINWFLWCGAILKNFELSYWYILNGCATFLRVVHL